MLSVDEREATHMSEDLHRSHVFPHARSITWLLPRSSAIPGSPMWAAAILGAELPRFSTGGRFREPAATFRGELVRLSTQRTRVRAALDATIGILSSVALGYGIVRAHAELTIVGVVAMCAGLILVTAAGVSIMRRRPAFSTPADRVTLIRAVLAGGCATLVVLALVASAPTRSWVLVGFAAIALLLDAIDGWVARRTGTANTHGARLDMETDSAFVMILSIPVALTVGPWALMIGAMRYLFWAAAVWRPALRQELTFSQFRRVTAGIQGVALVFALVPIVPSQVAAVTTALALALLVVSFGKDVISLERGFRTHGTTTDQPGA